MNTEIIDIYELTPMQVAILIDVMHSPQSESYHQQLTFRTKGQLDEIAWKNAWKLSVDQHDILRTSFHIEDLDKPLQAVHGSVEKQWYFEFDAIAQNDKTDIIDKLIEEDKQTRFNLNEPPLLRCKLVKFDEEEYFFIFSYHHLLLDGWSLAIVLRNVFENYKKLKLSGESMHLSAPSLRDYISYQQTKDVSSAELFWKSELSGYVNRCLFQGNISVVGELRNYAHYAHTCSFEFSSSVQQFARQNTVTPYIVFQAAWGILLSKFFNTSDVVFGSTVSGRDPEFTNVSGVVGLVMNTIPVRCSVDSNQRLLDFIHSLSEKQRQRDGFSYLNLSEIKQQSEVPTSVPLFETVLVYENYPIENVSDDEAQISVENLSLTEHPNVPLALIIIPGERIIIDAVFDQHKVNKKVVAELLRLLTITLQNILDKPELQIAQAMKFSFETCPYSFLSGPTSARSDHDTVISYFVSQSIQTPDTVALEADGFSCTYGELNQWSSSIANKLKKEGIDEYSRIGILMDNSPEMVATVLGALKIGACYVPIDPEYPIERINYIVKNARLKLILLQQKRAALRCNTPTDTYVVDQLPQKFPHNLIYDVTQGGNSDSVVYVIYTSGTTGNPKGIPITNSNLLNYVLWARDMYMEDGKMSVPLYTSLSFDLTVTSIFAPLISGGTILIYSSADRRLAIEHIMKEDKADIIKLTPTHLKLLREFSGVNHNARKFIVGGENLERSLADDILNKFPNAIIFNEYGPTETTVGCMIHTYRGSGTTSKHIPIGKPIANTRIYCLDDKALPVPYGAIGELWVSGPSVSKGYLDNQDLTNYAFQENPFHPGTVMYKTGDLARFSIDNELVYCGRTDDQIKYKGYRIELQECEAVMNSHPDIKMTAVLPIATKLTASASMDVQYCVQCGLPSNYPNVTFSSEGLCSICQDYQSYEEHVHAYFKDIDDLKKLFAENRQEKSNQYDCIMLYSGGKDSTYALCRLVKDFSLRVLVFSFDNGYISEQAKQNIRNVCSSLNVDLVFETSQGMNDIFRESLSRFSNVCNGCFKTIYTMALNLALKYGVKMLVTGLSRGQLFETRLHELYTAKIFDPEEIDRFVIEARKEYHISKDEVSRFHDTLSFQREGFFDEITFVDFYRYCDIKLDSMYDYIKSHVSWVRPKDTGRSTNCLINDLGIFVHKKEKGYHNYALPYSWDVRVGHKTREQTLDELNDELNLPKIETMMKEVGYNIKDTKNENIVLAAYYTSEIKITSGTLKSWVSKKMPSFMVPDVLFQIDNLPMTVNGKIDKYALSLKGLNRKAVTYLSPSDKYENEIATTWNEVLGVDRVSVDVNIFDIGGHSMSITIIYGRLRKKFDIEFSITDLYTYPTISSLAEFLRKKSQKDEEELINSNRKPQVGPDRRKARSSIDI